VTVTVTVTLGPVMELEPVAVLKTTILAVVVIAMVEPAIPNPTPVMTCLTN
jgi:hypothetical protein